MKKIIPLVLVIVLLFCGCKIKNFTPELTDFKQNASVDLGDFLYTCEICKKDDVVEIKVTSTNASGMSIIYDGEKVSFNYDDIVIDYNADKIDYTNPAIIIFDVFNYLNNEDNLSVLKIDNGFKYEGKTNLGEFILIQNEDLSYDSLVLKNANINIKFY